MAKERIAKEQLQRVAVEIRLTIVVAWQKKELRKSNCNPLTEGLLFSFRRCGKRKNCERAIATFKLPAEEVIRGGGKRKNCERAIATFSHFFLPLVRSMWQKKELRKSNCNLASYFLSIVRPLGGKRKNCERAIATLMQTPHQKRISGVVAKERIAKEQLQPASRRTQKRSEDEQVAKERIAKEQLQLGILTRLYSFKRVAKERIAKEQLQHGCPGCVPRRREEWQKKELRKSNCNCAEKAPLA